MFICIDLVTGDGFGMGLYDCRSLVGVFLCCLVGSLMCGWYECCCVYLGVSSWVDVTWVLVGVVCLYSYVLLMLFGFAWF